MVGATPGGEELPADLVQDVLAVAERVDHLRVELLPGLGDDLAARDAPALGVAVGAVVRDRVERVGDGEDPGAERDLLAAEAVGVAAPSQRSWCERPTSTPAPWRKATPPIICAPSTVCACITRHSARSAGPA